jgi:hypothetical protein
MNALLKKVPTGIKIGTNPKIWTHYRVHGLIVNSVMGIVGWYLLTLPKEIMPITFGTPMQKDFNTVVDYQSGRRICFTKERQRAIVNI